MFLVIDADDAPTFMGRDIDEAQQLVLDWLEQNRQPDDDIEVHNRMDALSSKNVYNRFPRGCMAKKFTQSIRFGLTPEQLKRIRAEAQEQKISASELVRTAIENYLRGMSEWRRIVGKRAQKANRANLLNTPLVVWKPGEKEFADEVLRIHFDEDR